MMSFPLNSSPTPLYYRLEEALRSKILNRVYLPGQPIPTELQLQKEYGVSRETVRRAVNDLVIAGLLVRSRGVGTYVASPKITHRIGSIYSSTEEILARGMTPGTRYIEKKKISPTEEVRESMGLAKDSPVFKVKRLRLADDEPVAILTSYVNAALVPGLASQPLKDDSLYRTFEDVYRLTLYECDEVIEAALLDGKEARLLGLGPSGPVLVVNRLTYLSDGLVIEKLIAHYRSDKFKYQVKLRGRNEGRLL